MCKKCAISYGKVVLKVYNSTDHDPEWTSRPGRVHCDNGHEYTPENTLIRRPDNKPYRQCRQCRDDSHQRNQQTRRERRVSIPHVKKCRSQFDACSYNTIHSRCSKLWGSAKQHQCVSCDAQAANWAYDGTDPTEICGKTQTGYVMVWSRFPEFYMPLCRNCHGPRDTTWRKDLKVQFSEFQKWRLEQTG